MVILVFPAVYKETEGDQGAGSAEVGDSGGIGRTAGRHCCVLDVFS